MTSQIPSLLSRWSAKQPTVCKEVIHPLFPNVYVIERYEFWVDYKDQLNSKWRNGETVKGQPALDWLRGVCERAIEAMDRYNISYSKHAKDYIITISNKVAIRSTDNPTEALLTALVEYLEGQNNEN